MFPQQVLDDIVLGETYLADLVEQYQTKFYTGGCNCDIETMYMLTSIMKDLEYKSSIGIYDTVSQGLYATMMLIIGGVAYVPPVLSNTAYTGTGIPTTEAEILAGLATAYTEETGLIAEFSNPDYLVNFLAIPILAPIPTQYVNVNNPFDTGMIGSPEDLFGAFTEIGDFRVATTNYVIPLTDTYLFF